MLSGKKFAIRFLPILFATIMLITAACGGSTSPTSSTPASQAAPASKQNVRIPIGATDFSTLDPALVQSATDAETIQTIFNGLVSLNDKVEVVDQLAQSHQISSDGLTYTFTLRPHLKFSDGTPLTSKDVAYSINRTLLPATKSQVAYYLNLIKDYDKVTTGKITTIIGDSLLTPDDNTLKIIISKPAAYFLNALTYPVTYPVEQKLITQYGTNWTDHLDQGGGAGPFKVTSYSHNTGVTEAPNPNYFGAPSKIQKLQFLQSGDSATTLKAYLNGQFDQSLVIPPSSLATYKTHKDFVSAPLLVIRYITMNYLTKPFDNIHIRQAFALATNKDVIATDVLKGAVVPTNHLVPQGMPGYNTSLKGIQDTGTSGNVAMAKQLLQQGLQEEHMTTLPPITYTYYTDSASVVAVSQALVQMWQTNLGVTVKTQPILFDKLLNLTNASINNPKGLQMWILGWQADYPDPQDWLSTFFSKGAADNLTNYGQNSNSYAAQQVAVQKQLDQADVDQDPTNRLKTYATAEQQVVNDVGWIPLYQSALNYLQNPKIANYAKSYSDPQNTIEPMDWANIFVTA